MFVLNVLLLTLTETIILSMTNWT